MKKLAYFASNWPVIYQKLNNPPPELLNNNYPKIQKLKGILPKFPMSKFNINPQKLQSNPQAVGYVSTEDADSNGKIDTINLSSPRIEEEFSKLNIPVGSFLSLSPEEMGSILEPIAGLLLHEIGHLGGQSFTMLNPDNPEQSFKSEQEADRFALIATNTSDRNEKLGSFKMKELDILSKLASDLDAAGATEVADVVDQILVRLASSDLGRQIYDDVLRGKYGEYPQQLLNGGAINTLAMGQRYDEAMKIMYKQLLRGEGASETVNRTDLMGRLKKLWANKEPVSDEILSPTRREEKMVQTEPAPKTRTGLSAFQKETGLSDKYISKIQEKLISLGYDVGSKTGRPDGVWGPSSTKAWYQMLMDAQKSFEAEKLEPYRVKARLDMLVGGDIDKVIFMMDRLVNSPNFAKGKFERDVDKASVIGDPRVDALKRLQMMEPSEREVYRRENPEDYKRLIDLANSRRDKSLEMWPEFKNMADDDESGEEGDEVKTASNKNFSKDDYMKAFWLESNAPFGRSNSKFKF